MDSRYYRVNFSKPLKIKFELTGGSHVFFDNPEVDDTLLYVAGGEETGRLMDEETIIYTVELDPDRKKAVVSPHIWIAALEIPAPSDPTCVVTLLQDGKPVAAFVPPMSKDTFSVTETFGSDEQAELRIPALYLYDLTLDAKLAAPKSKGVGKGKGGAK